MTHDSPTMSGRSVVLRPVEPSDDEFLLQVYAGTRQQELDQVTWLEGQREQFIRWQFEMQRNEYHSRFPNARYDVIEVDGNPAGRMWVGVEATQIRLLDIAVTPEYQNQGVGSSLVRQLMDEASQEKKPLRHMVFVLNDNALRFYERLGFEVFEDLGGYKHMQWLPENIREE